MDNRPKIIMLAISDEAETGNAGEQPVRNSPINVNSRRLVLSDLRFKTTIYIIMPKKTQIFNHIFQIFFCGFVRFTLKQYSFSILEINKEAVELSEIYRMEVIKNEINDSIHIALASINSLDAIISWNFKHIVNLNTINKIHTINIRQKLKIIEILTPENLGGDKYANL